MQPSTIAVQEKEPEIPGHPRILLLPGLYDSDSDHWQSLWERQHPSWQRVRQNEWTAPHCSDWVTALHLAIRASDTPALLVAHSLGCCLVAHWASHHTGFVQGALLVAPPDVDAPTFPGQVTGFAPMPSTRLPFPSIVVASENDPFCSLPRSQSFADYWGARLVVLGRLGHINGRSGLGAWPAGLRLLAELAAEGAGLLPQKGPPPSPCGNKIA